MTTPSRARGARPTLAFCRSCGAMTCWSSTRRLGNGCRRHGRRGRGRLGRGGGLGGRGGLGVGVEIPHRHVPAEQDRHGQDPGQDHVAVILLVHCGPLLGKFVVGQMGKVRCRSRHRIKAMPSPGMAAHYTLHCQPATLNCAVFFERLDRILRARRGIAARRRQDPRRTELPAPRNQDQQAFHRRFLGGSPLPSAARDSAMANSSRSLAKSRSTPPSRPIRT